MKIKTNNWKLFRLDEVFIVYGGYYNKKPEHSKKGNIPFLGATETNNGATDYYSKKDIREWDKVGDESNSISGKLFPFPSIAVTVNGSVCNAYYQDSEFTCSHDISVLVPKDGHELTQMEALFCCTIIQQEKYRWSYGRKPHDIEKLSAMEIKLPKTDEGEPDWDYMSSFMKELRYKPLKTSKKSSRTPLNKKKWKEFVIGGDDGIFKIKRGKRLIEEDREAGDVLYFSASESNNGLTDMINNPLFVEKDSLIYSTFGDCYYVRGEFTASDEISILQNKNMTEYSGLFIATIINSNKYKYQYGRKAFQNKFVNEIIKLPATQSGEPDWNWMDNYIKSLPMAEYLE